MTSPMNILTGAGPVAGAQATLGWWLMIVSAVVVTVVAILVLVGGLRRRNNREALVQRTGAGMRWVIVGGVIVPAIILIVTFAFTIATENAIAAPSADPAVTVQVIGHRWWWEIRYAGDPQHTVVTAGELHVPVGLPVRVELTSADVIPGQRNVTWIEADKPGVYRGQCTEYCGMQHSNMAVFVVAEPPAQFAHWLDSQSKPAAAPTDPDAAAGMAVFQKSACATCHAIRGTDALGRVGPDLTHVADRTTIAGGALANTRGNLAGWIANSQAIKPGNDMPTMTLSAGDLQALVSYLETLK